MEDGDDQRGASFDPSHLTPRPPSAGSVLPRLAAAPAVAGAAVPTAVTRPRVRAVRGDAGAMARICSRTRGPEVLQAAGPPHPGRSGLRGRLGRSDRVHMHYTVRRTESERHATAPAAFSVLDQQVR